MTAAVVSLALLMLVTALRGTAVLFLALGVTRLMGRSSAAARHLIWVTALATVLLLPIASRLLPAWHLLPLPVLTSAPRAILLPYGVQRAPRTPLPPQDRVAAEGAKIEVGEGQG